MKVDHCDHCEALVFFENTRCLNCGSTLAYLPDPAGMAALEAVEGEPGLWQRLGSDRKTRYRLCENYSVQNICNWAVDAETDSALCACCRLTTVIPDLSVPGHKEAWAKLENAKRRLVYSLHWLKLPIIDRHQDPAHGLSFEFMADGPDGTEPVLTGHDDGVITINIAEADDAEREKRRVQMHEPYRTLLGHFRHEVGHYYQDILLNDPAKLDESRRIFGDERADYSEALQKHYDEGPPADWSENFISTYATAHPWEDWAETWAHYLHMTDTLEIAAACGLALRPRDSRKPSIDAGRLRKATANGAFEKMIENWFPLTFILNNLNRGLGQPDGYPFVMSDPAIEKLRFVHEAIHEYEPTVVRTEQSTANR